MSRTYWRAKVGGDWEFLGAFADGAKAKKEPFLSASILDIQEMSAQQTLDAMNDRFTLSNAPRSIVRNMESKQTIGLPMEQISGYLK